MANISSRKNSWVRKDNQVPANASAVKSVRGNTSRKRALGSLTSRNDSKVLKDRATMNIVKSLYMWAHSVELSDPKIICTIQKTWMTAAGILILAHSILTSAKIKVLSILVSVISLSTKILSPIKKNCVRKFVEFPLLRLARMEHVVASNGAVLEQW